MKEWTNYFTSHFYAMKMRPVSAFDPSGFMIVIAAVLLVVGIILSGLRRLVYHNRELLEEAKQHARMRMEKNLQEVSEYVNSRKSIMGENLQYVKGRAIDHSGRQGFIAEMLSYAYLSRLGFSVAIFALASYLNALAAVIAGCVSIASLYIS
jgi:hypothetical protein